MKLVKILYLWLVVLILVSAVGYYALAGWMRNDWFILAIAFVSALSLGAVAFVTIRGRLTD